MDKQQIAECIKREFGFDITWKEQGGYSVRFDPAIPLDDRADVIAKMDNRIYALSHEEQTSKGAS